MSAQPRFQVQITSLADSRARRRVGGFIARHSKLDSVAVESRLENLPVLLVKGAGLKTAVDTVRDVARRGATVAARSNLSPRPLESLPGLDARPVLRETLKPFVAMALRPRELVRYVACGVARLRPLEYLATGGLSSYLSRHVALVATTERVLVIALATPQLPLRFLYELQPGACARVSASATVLTFVATDERELSFCALETGEASSLAQTIKDSDLDNSAPFTRPLCGRCGTRLASSLSECLRCGVRSLAAWKAAAASLVCPGWFLFRERRLIAASVVWLSSLGILFGLSVWRTRAYELGHDALGWQFPIAVWAVWIATHSLAEWSRVNDQTGET